LVIDKFEELQQEVTPLIITTDWDKSFYCCRELTVNGAFRDIIQEFDFHEFCLEVAGEGVHHKCENQTKY